MYHRLIMDRGARGYLGNSLGFHNDRDFCWSARLSIVQPDSLLAGPTVLLSKCTLRNGTLVVSKVRFCYSMALE